MFAYVKHTQTFDGRWVWRWTPTPANVILQMQPRWAKSFCIVLCWAGNWRLGFPRKTAPKEHTRRSSLKAVKGPTHYYLNLWLWTIQGGSLFRKIPNSISHLAELNHSHRNSQSDLPLGKETDQCCSHPSKVLFHAFWMNHKFDCNVCCAKSWSNLFNSAKNSQLTRMQRTCMYT